jgi:nucleoside-diphosphate-sugar epimerase
MAFQRAFVTGGSGFLGGRLIRRLAADGVVVRALARSDRAASAVAASGASPVLGDLSDRAALRAGAQGCDVAFHAAAHLGDWGDRAEFERVNVTGTENVVAACRDAGVPRFVHVGTEAALMAGAPLVRVDESAPLRPDSPALYSSTKARAELAVRAAAADGFGTVAVRPRFIWGAGDTTLLPQLVQAVRDGRFAWIGSGRHLVDTTHVDNVVHGLLLAAASGRPGAAYFVTDGEPVEWRAFVTELLAAVGVEAPRRSVPAPVARALAATGETLWGLLPLPGRPPLTRLAYWVAGQECTLDISRARVELGYVPVVTREAGLAELRAGSAVA